ncbi:zinc ribbon domain-containing protein [Candidatus Woesearchaeota archaeon]|nr:zinc ribbon domain-containing protein [Candidatus Woesearchaeota archaeon]
MDKKQSVAKRKSKFIGFLFAIFSGPISFLYVRKRRKALVLSALLFVPYINICIYIYSLFGIVGDVKQFNSDVGGNARFGFVVCACQNLVRVGCKFCSSCGAKLVKSCSACNASIEKDGKFCSSCGHAFENIGIIKNSLKKRFWLARVL